MTRGGLVALESDPFTDIQWDAYLPGFKGSPSIWAKARAFVDLGLVEYMGHNQFVVHPKPGYNVTDYAVRNEGGFFTCTCQGFVTKLRKFTKGEFERDEVTCSHVRAVKIYAGNLMHEKKIERLKSEGAVFTNA